MTTNFEIPENPEYIEEIRKFKPTDPAHADLFNAVIQALINNDAYLKKLLLQVTSDAILQYQQLTGYTDQKIASLINGAPTTLDTLGEIAEAMQDNGDVVAALDAAIGAKASAVEVDSMINALSSSINALQTQINEINNKLGTQVTYSVDGTTLIITPITNTNEDEEESGEGDN